MQNDLFQNQNSYSQLRQQFHQQGHIQRQAFGPPVGWAQDGGVGGANSDCGCNLGSNTGLPDMCHPDPDSNYLGCTCVLGETRVPMADGGCKPAAEVKVGDHLLGLGGSEEIVERVFGGTQPALEIITGVGVLICSESHLLLTEQSNAVRAGDLKLGSHVLTSESATTEVRSIRSVGEQPVYGWTCTPSHVYQAGPLLNHNKAIAVPNPPAYVTAQ